MKRFYGKKSIQNKLNAVFLATALLAAALAFFACGNDSASSNDSYISGNFGTDENGTGGGDNTGNEGEGNGDENGNESGDDDEPTAKIATVTDVLKLVMEEAEYTKISENVSSGNITLTAQTIKAVGDTFSGLSNYKGKEKDIKNIAETDRTFISNDKEVFVAQDKGLINITKSGSSYKLNSYTIPVKFDDTFNLSEISLPENTSDNKGDFSNATLTNNGEGISIDKLNTIRGTSLPTLIFAKVTDEGNRGMPVDDIDKHSYNLYKDYSKYLTKLDISGDFAGTEINGKEISGNSNYTLLKDDGNTVKPATDTSVKTLTIDALIQMYKQLKISYFVNMIISEDAKEAINVDWKLTNIIFEGDMNEIKNIGQKDLTGIVYFKKKAYNTNRQAVNGLLKLDSLEGVSEGTFGIDLSESSAVLDVRGVNTSAINSYNSNLLVGGGYAHAIYFSDAFSSIKDSQEEINKLCDKFSDKQGQAKFIYAYLGSNKVKGQDYDDKPNEETYGSPRSLSDFEYFGNYKKFKSDNNTFALNNKRIEFIDPETQKIVSKRFV